MLDTEEMGRLAVRARLGELVRAPQERYDMITRLACGVFRTPVALVSMVGADTVWCKSAQGWKPRPLPRAASLCAEAVRQDDPLLILDAHADPRYRSHPLVVGPPFVRFYAGHPLRTADGLRIAVLSVQDTRPRAKWTHHDAMMLAYLAGSAETEMRLCSG